MAQEPSKYADAVRRAFRTFLQGAVGVFAIAAIGPLNQLITGVVSGDGSDAAIDLNLWRNIGLACMAGGVIALVSFLQNALEDAGVVKSIAKPKDRQVGDQVMGEQP